MMIRYINHKGEEICISRTPYRILNLDELYSSTADSSGFVEEARNISLDILSTKDKTWKESYDVLKNICDVDIFNNTVGRLCINDYYLPCFISTALPSGVNLRAPYCTCKFDVVSKGALWIKEVVHPYLSSATPVDGETTKRYPYRHPYRYRPRIGVSTLFNNLPMPSHYKLVIYGPVKNPSVTIDNHLYQVFADVLENEYLTITFANGKKTVKRYLRDGSENDEFNNRNKQISVFEKIDIGLLPVQWSGDFAFDVVLLSERSIPPWI